VCATRAALSSIDRSMPTHQQKGRRRPVSNCLSIYRGRWTTRQQDTLGLCGETGATDSTLFSGRLRRSLPPTRACLSHPGPSRRPIPAATVVFTECSRTMAIQSLVDCPKTNCQSLAAHGACDNTTVHTHTDTQTRTHCPPPLVCVALCVRLRVGYTYWLLAQLHSIIVTQLSTASCAGLSKRIFIRGIEEREKWPAHSGHRRHNAARRSLALRAF
jgi:hypothetical protein